MKAMVINQIAAPKGADLSLGGGEPRSPGAQARAHAGREGPVDRL